MRGMGRILRGVAGQPGGAVGLAIVVAVLVAAAASPLVATHDPDALDILHRFAGPSWGHWLGTDQLGRDLYSRLVYGAQVAMAVALSAIAAALVAGTLAGVLAGLLGGAGEAAALVLLDVVASFPSLVLALAAVAVFGPSTPLVVAVVAVTLAPQFGRVARAQVLTLRHAPFVTAERLLGASTARIVFSHLLPNIAGPLVVLASIEIPVVITIEAGLSFIGLGVRPPLASWGTLINDGYSYLSDSSLPVVVASSALGLATLGFTLFGEALRDAADPRAGGRR